MNWNHIQLEVKDHVAILALNRPRVLNALNREMVDELDQAAGKIAADQDIKVLILTGNGEHFAAGADITNMVDFVPEQARAFAFTSTFNKIESLPQPIIAAVKGYALGAGFELALTADIRLAGESARFGLPEINLGIMPGAGGSQRLPRLIGAARAKELIYLGNNIDAAAALSLGIINCLLPDEELLDEAYKMAARIASKSTVAMRTAKKTINLGLNLDLKSATEMETIAWGDLFASHDQKEGMQAFLEKRKPQFKGN